MIERTLEERLVTLAHSFPAVFLTGPRQSGKTTLARASLPDFAYFNLEDLDVREEAVEDPRTFLRRLEGGQGAILDEVQRAPDLFSYLQGFIDEKRGGPLVLTGSQQFLLSEKVSQTLAGRVAVLELLPFSVAELARRPALLPRGLSTRGEAPAPPERSLEESLVVGSFPRIHDEGLEAATWLDGYVRTYVERDVRALRNVGDIDTFTRFVRLCAGRAGQLVNFAALGSDAGVSQPTAKQWLSILRASYVLDLLPAHHVNFNKRLVRRPKMHFHDSGLLCFLLGIRDAEQLSLHPLRGAVFESFVVSEFRKSFLHRGQPAPLYFWRDSHGRELDVIVDDGLAPLPVEVKSGRTVAGDAFRNLEYHAGLSGRDGGLLVYGGDRSYARRGIHVIPWFACS